MNKKISKIKILKQKYTDIDPFIFDLILTHTTGKTKEFLYTHPEYNLNLFETTKLKFYLNKIKKGLPYHYLTKNKDFYNLNFFVNKYTLIPRPETELMIEEVLEHTKCHSERSEESNTILIDVGTGTGCIPIVLKSKIQNLNIKFYAIDISKKALKVAKKNAKKNGVDINFLHGDLLKPFLKQFNNSTIQQFNKIIVTANLPYLTKLQMSEPSIQKEPKLALYGGSDGLKFYKKLLKQITLIKNKIQATIYFEIDPTQTTKIQNIIKEHLPEASIQIKKDSGGLERLVIITTQS